MAEALLAGVKGEAATEYAGMDADEAINPALLMEEVETARVVGAVELEAEELL